MKMNKIIWLLLPLVLSACIAPIPVSRESIIGEDRARFWQDGYDAIEPGQTTRRQVVESLRKPYAEWVEARTLIYYAGPPGGTQFFICIGAGGGGYCDVTEKTASRREIIILVRLTDTNIVASKDWLKGPSNADKYGQFLREWIAPDAPRQAIRPDAVPVVFQLMPKDQAAEEAARTFEYRLINFETGGRLKPGKSSKARLLKGEDSTDDWMRLELVPGSHYLRSVNSYGEMFQIDIPRGADVVYAGKINRGLLSYGVDINAIDLVTDDYEASETVLRTAFPRAENIGTAIFRPYDGPILLYEPLPNAPLKSD